jgi:type II secretory pathway pseudopilin PulG
MKPGSQWLRRPGRQWLGGFTLTDLLVVVAVLSMVAALVFAPLLAAKRKSRLARCTANLQGVNRAILSFAEDNDKRLPSPSPGQPGDLWWWYKEQVKRYAGLSGPSSPKDTVFACPDDRGYTDPKPFHVSARFDYSSYVFNGVILPGLPNIAGWPVPSVSQPRKTLLVMEWTAHAPLSWHKSRTGQENRPFYCDALSVAGFVDGHVSLTRIYYDGYNAAYTQDPIAGYDYKYSGN